LQYFLLSIIVGYYKIWLKSRDRISGDQLGKPAFYWFVQWSN
jgi:hypothetical protein